MMRIITGTARGVRLRTLEGEETRPTAERTKEAVFSVLQFELAGKRVLDAFAGSGQMGLEALSRGAAGALLIDKNRAAAEIIKKNVELTRMSDRAEVACGETIEQLKRRSGKEQYDIVFLDPPYKSDLIRQVMRQLIEGKMLSENATVVCESGEPLAELLKNDADLLDKITLVKTARYGIAHITFVKLRKEGDQE
jgi:16S rRNA (guanine(966)-N(2))-methyltransferase RsmD